MRKFRDVLGMIRLFFCLVKEMIKNYRKLGDELEHNFLICKAICTKIVNKAKIQLYTWEQELLPVDRPFLFVSNHRCFFDVVFLLAGIEQPISFVAAKELFRYPLLRRYLRSIQCISLDRYTKNMTDLKGSITEIRTSLSDHNLVLFPEGECSYRSDQMNSFKKGGFVGIHGMDIQIVPAFIRLGEIRNIGRWMIPRGEVDIYIGNPFQVEEVSEKRPRASEIAAYAQDRVKELQEKTIKK